jgi:C4-dicarboxylate-specific signal transduction histidine kinase
MSDDEKKWTAGANRNAHQAKLEEAIRRILSLYADRMEEGNNKLAWGELFVGSGESSLEEPPSQRTL